MYSYKFSISYSLKVLKSAKNQLTLVEILLNEQEKTLRKILEKALLDDNPKFGLKQFSRRGNHIAHIINI